MGGQLIEGAQNIFFAELSQPGIAHFSVAATRFMSGKFPLMIFGLPGAALAMYRCADPGKRKEAGGLLLSAALTSMLTGITEPLEFTFLFVAPVLYGIHCVFAGAAYMLMHMCNVGVGMTFSGGLIDLFLFGILQGNAKTDWVRIVFVGIGYFIVYYFLFSFLIRRFDFKTPGRESGADEVKLYTRADVNARKQAEADGTSVHLSGNGKGTENSGQKDEGKRRTGATGHLDDGRTQTGAGTARTFGDAMEVSALITEGLGGRDNISDVDCCATRLRVTVHDEAKVDELLLKESGAAGVIRRGKGIQVVYGPRVTVIKSDLEDYLSR